MRRLIGLILIVVGLAVAPAFAQATRIQSSGTLPATCTVGNIYLKTGASAGFYLCLATDTWTGPVLVTDVSNAQLANMAEATVKMRAVGAGTGDPIDGTPDQLSTLLDDATDPFIRESAGSGFAGVEKFGITIDGGGSDISTGVKGFVRLPYTGTITKATVLSTDASATACAIVIDVLKDSYANYPPDDMDSITDSAPPTLSGPAAKSEDSTLTGWGTSVTAGEVAGFKVVSNTGCTRVHLSIEVTP